jgi:hypothetical protein
VQTVTEEGPGEGRKQLGRPKPRRDCNIGMYLQETRCEGIESTDLSAGDKWQAIDVN